MIHTRKMNVLGGPENLCGTKCPLPLTQSLFLTPETTCFSVSIPLHLHPKTRHRPRKGFERNVQPQLLRSGVRVCTLYLFVQVIPKPRMGPGSLPSYRLIPTIKFTKSMKREMLLGLSEGPRGTAVIKLRPQPPRVGPGPQN